MNKLLLFSIVDQQCQYYDKVHLRSDGQARIECHILNDVLHSFLVEHGLFVEVFRVFLCRIFLFLRRHSFLS
jgi:hypothetical protein